ncbi:MAG: amidohydrolase [Bacteroidetes bacterium HGW-Bacteroidetes-21]|nr:MAG: amidohydrolase [Bacteroidetes bacterium HGW-Bacteroidetes-21]
MKVPEDLLEKLTTLRRKLHSIPELSGREKQTVTILNQFVRNYGPDKIIPEIGKSGLAYIYKGAKEGPTILLRADMDAVAIHETSEIHWASIHPGVSHKCGHDGHMAILAGVAALLFEQRPEKGRIVLLFQPSEENGKGAFEVINDSRFSAIEPDVAIALHNLPGFEMGTLLLREGVMAMASKGIRFVFQGIDSHASEPEKGISPLPVMTAFIDFVENMKAQLQSRAVITTCHMQLGEPSFGVNPGQGVIHLTVRTETASAMQDVCDELIMQAGNLAQKSGVMLKTDYHDEFPETKNNKDLIQEIQNAALKSRIKVATLSKSFKWSEDFGYFTRDYKGALIGLGSGTNQPPLHHPLYDFPDEAIEPGLRILFEILKDYCF